MATKIESYYFSDAAYKPVVSITNPNNNGDAKAIEKNLYSSGRVTLLSTSGNFSNYTIDGTVDVRVPSDQFRTTQATYWADWRTSYERGAWLCGTATVVGGIGTYVSSKYPEVFFVAALVGLFMTCYLIKCAHDATVQQKGWEVEPGQTVAADRKMAYEMGFSHVFEQKMKIGPNAVLPRLAPFEVTYLFEKYLGTRSQELLSEAPPTSQAKNDWLKKFTTTNPISRAVLNYAYESVPNKFEQISQDYETLAGKLNTIRETAQKKREEIGHKTKKQIQNATKSKKAADNLVHLGSSVVEDKKGRKTVRNAASFTTSIIASSQIDQANEEHALTVATINQEENEALAAHYSAAQKILEKAKKI